MEQMRRYLVGIQTFSDIIEGGYTYVGKTGLMWKMQHLAKYAFLSRPRRFGKSLLSSTIHSFFDGDRRLFEGLKVMEFEKDWKKHPVIHLDLSQAKGMKSVKELRDRICMLLRDYTAIYGDDPLETMPGSMLNVYVRTQVKCAGGRADMVVHMPDAIYVVELKINGTAQEALDQINSRRYTIPYSTSGKKVVKVGVSFSMETKTIEDWIIAE